MIGRLLITKRIKAYNTLMAKGRYDRATLVAYKEGLGAEMVAESAKKWYDQLLDARNPDVACAVAIKFNLPDSYLKYAMAEELRRRASDIEEASYKFIQDAQEMLAQAKEIENSTFAINDFERDGFAFNGENSCELRSRGERIIAQALESGSFFRERKDGKRFGLEADVFYKIGLAVFENELIFGNKKYADLIAKSYKIKDSDRKLTIEAVRSRKENNNADSQS